MTLENSPEPVGLLDGPDDGDWISTHPLLSRLGAYANPVGRDRSLEYTYALAQAVDSVIVEHLQSPAQITRKIVYGARSAGQWTENVDASALPLGLGRVHVRAYAGSTMAEAHGDIFVYTE